MKASLPLQAIFLAATQITGSLAAPGPAPAPDSCRCLPGDACWPSAARWHRFNETVGGRLVASEPIGSPCHDPTYDAEACEALREEWFNPLTQYVASVALRTFSPSSPYCWRCD